MAVTAGAEEGSRRDGRQLEEPPGSRPLLRWSPRSRMLEDVGGEARDAIMEGRDEGVGDGNHQSTTTTRSAACIRVV